MRWLTPRLASFRISRYLTISFPFVVGRALFAPDQILGKANLAKPGLNGPITCGTLDRSSAERWTGCTAICIAQTTIDGVVIVDAKRSVMRGLHFQIEHPQSKLVRVVPGEVFDVAIDLRQGSATYGK